VRRVQWQPFVFRFFMDNTSTADKHVIQWWCHKNCDCSPNDRLIDRYSCRILLVRISIWREKKKYNIRHEC
jgi:hypothetical protein